MFRDSEALAVMERGSTAISAAHAELVATQVQDPAARHGIDLPLVAVTDPPPIQQFFRGGDGRWLVASRFDCDPATVSRGATYAPERVIRRLDALLAADIEFDEIYLLDELPPDWRPGEPVPEMRPLEEHRAKQVVARQEVILQAGVKAAKGLLAAGKVAGQGLAAAGATIGSITAYDPVILGGVRDPATGQFAWLLVDRWDEVSAS
jgi:hypothetical protein